MSKHEFNLLDRELSVLQAEREKLQKKLLEVNSEITRKQLEKLLKKHFGGE